MRSTDDTYTKRFSHLTHSYVLYERCDLKTVYDIMHCSIIIVIILNIIDM